MIPAEDEIQEAFHRARVSAQKHMAVMDIAGDTWGEVPVTAILLAAGAPTIKFATFTQQHQEPLVGADWIWWWVDSNGEAFGMVVQAKRLKKLPKGWEIDFDYKNGAQRAALLESAFDLRLPAMYALYLGTPVWRDGAFCQASKHSESCVSCDRSTVSMLPAIVTTAALGVHSVEVSLALDATLPLEAIADPAIRVDPVWDSNLRDLEPDVAEFLREPQMGARRVAQLIFERVTYVRAMGFSGAAGTSLLRGTEQVFPNIPDDFGHFSRRYWPEILDGLRRKAPDYVLDLIADQPLPDHISSRFAGIAVFQV